MPVRQLKKFLDDHKVKYQTKKHSPAYTSLELAQLAHIPGKEWAKTVIVEIDGRMAMVVLSADRKIDLHALRDGLHAKQTLLANEFDFKDKFPGCELGAMPPFGNLYDMDVYIDKRLCKDKTIAFNGGTHTEIIQMGLKDYQNLVHPEVLDIAA